MHEKSKELMLVAAWHIEKEAASMGECERFKRAMDIASELRHMAGATEPEPEVITPIGPEAEWYDPAEFVPEPMCDVDVIWSSADGKHSVRGIAYRHPVGRWVAVDDDPDMTVEPTAWTPRPQLPKWVDDKR